MRSFALVVPRSEVLDEVAECVRFGLECLGHSATVRYSEFPSGARPVIFGGHIIEDFGALPPGAILVNFEPLRDARLSPTYIDALRRFTVWDYSRRNLDWLRENGGLNAQWLRVGYSPALSRIQPAPQDIDVLFYGTPNERRVALLKDLIAAGLKVIAFNSLFGARRDEMIARAKVVLNLHFYAQRVFEIARVSYLLANRKAVVSEVGPDTEIEDDLRGAVCGSPYEGLVDACREIVADADKRAELERRGFGIFSARDQAAFLRDLIG